MCETTVIIAVWYWLRAAGDALECSDLFVGLPCFGILAETEKRSIAPTYPMWKATHSHITQANSAWPPTDVFITAHLNLVSLQIPTTVDDQPLYPFTYLSTLWRPFKKPTRQKTNLSTMKLSRSQTSLAITRRPNWLIMRTRMAACFRDMTQIIQTLGITIIIMVAPLNITS